MVRKDKQHTTYQIGMSRNASETLCPAVRNPVEIQKFDVIVAAALFCSACNSL